MENYNEIINSSRIVLVEFYAEWCPHCQRMKPIVGEITKDMEGKALVYTYDIDKNQELAQQNNVETIPTFLLYKNGKVVWQYSGEITRAEIENVISSFY